LEANPNSHYKNMFFQLREAGINRLSLGVQALNEKDLCFLGRTHSLAQAYKAIEEVLQNFNNHSIDLIYARPQQKIDDWLGELKVAASLGLRHISLYQLTIEPNTVFARKRIKSLDEDKAAEMYLATESVLSSYGYNKYEVSNYAQSGFASKHNLVYWTGGEYIGVGPSAHGRLTSFDGNLEQNSDARNSCTNLYTQVSALRDFTLSSSSKLVKSDADGKLEQNQKYFYATTHRCQLEKISAEDRAEELLLMGLRLVKGIDKAEFMDVCGIDFNKFVNQAHLQNLKNESYIEENNQRIWVTAKGFPILDFIILQLVS